VRHTHNFSAVNIGAYGRSTPVMPRTGRSGSASTFVQVQILPGSVRYLAYRDDSAGGVHPAPQRQMVIENGIYLPLLQRDRVMTDRQKCGITVIPRREIAPVFLSGISLENSSHTLLCLCLPGSFRRPSYEVIALPRPRGGAMAGGAGLLRGGMANPCEFLPSCSCSPRLSCWTRSSPHASFRRTRPPGAEAAAGYFVLTQSLRAEIERQEVLDARQLC